jgi:hypothetical protein
MDGYIMKASEPFKVAAVGVFVILKLIEIMAKKRK